MRRIRSYIPNFGCLNLILCTVCFACYCITSKCLYLGGISPYQLNFIVNVLTLIVMGIWLRIKPPPTYKPSEFNYYLSQAVIMGFMSTLWTFAVYFADPANISLFIGLGPLMTGIIKFYLGLDSLCLVQYVITTSFAVFGMVLALQPSFLFGASSTSQSSADWIGYLLMFIAVLSYSTFAVCQRIRKTDEILTLFMRTVITAGVFAVCTIFESWHPINFFQWLQILFMIFLNTSSLCLLAIGCQETPATTSALLFLLEIPFTYLGTALIFDKILGITTYCGVALILLSIGHYLILNGSGSDLAITQYGGFETPEMSPLLRAKNTSAADCFFEP